MNRQKTTKTPHFALVLMMKVDYPFTTKAQVTVSITCAPSFNPPGSSYFNRLRLTWITVRKA